MDKKLLPKNFFQDNPLDELPAPLIAYFSMRVGFNERLQDVMRETLENGLDLDRKTVIAEEKEKISQLETGEETVKFIRSGYDIVNRELLCNRVLAMQAEVLPPLLQRFRTSAQNSGD